MNSTKQPTNQPANIGANTFSEHTELCYGCCFCYTRQFTTVCSGDDDAVVVATAGAAAADVAIDAVVALII